MSEHARELLKNMKSTAAARYNASKRLEAREASLTRLTAFTSAYVIGLTVLPYFLSLPPGGADRMNLLTLLMGVIILVASLMQYSSRDGVNAEQHYRCGLEIGEMRRCLKIEANSITDAELVEYAKLYALALQKYSINHDQVDIDQYRIEREEEAASLNKSEKLRIHWDILRTRHLANMTLIGITIVIGWLLMAIVSPAWELAAPAVRS